MAFAPFPDRTELLRAQAHRLAFNLETLQVTIEGHRPGVLIYQLLDQIYTLEQICSQLQSQLNLYMVGSQERPAEIRPAKRSRSMGHVSEAVSVSDTGSWKSFGAHLGVLTANCNSFVLPCGYCHRTFTTKGALSRHQGGHLRKGDQLLYPASPQSSLEIQPEAMAKNISE